MGCMHGAFPRSARRGGAEVRDMVQFDVEFLVANSLTLPLVCCCERYCWWGLWFWGLDLGIGSERITMSQNHRLRYNLATIFTHGDPL